MIILFLLEERLMKKQKNIDDAYKKLEMINQWINNSDSKSSIVLGLVGIFL